MNVVFAVPFALDTSLRFLRGVAELDDIRLGVVSQEPPGRLPPDLQPKVVAHERVSDALDPDELEAAVRRLAQTLGGRVDCLLGILEQLQGPMAEVRERLRIRGMDSHEAANFRDKKQMKDALRAAGIPCARHHLAESVQDAIGGAREIGFPLVMKPPAGAGARSTVRVESADELSATLRQMPPRPGEPLLLEEFLYGAEHSFDSVTVGGKHLFHSISRYYPTPLEVLEKPWAQWCVILPRDVSGAEYAEIHEVGARALDVLGMVTGITHMEWFRREDGSVAISEVAARPPGAQFTSLLSWAHDIDFYKAWGRLMVFEEFDVPEREYACGAVFLRAQGHGRIEGVDGLDAIREELGGLVVDARMPRIGQPTSGTYEGEGYVIVRHPETSKVEEACKRLLSAVRVRLGPTKAGS